MLFRSAASTTATNNNSTGALLVAGGTAIAGNLNVGGQAFIGAGAQSTAFTNPISVERGTSASGAGVQHIQHALINASNTGSSDFAAYGNNYNLANGDHGWLNVGFTGDAFNDTAYTLTKPNDGYIFASGANATVGGNLVMSTDGVGSYNDKIGRAHV